MNTTVRHNPFATCFTRPGKIPFLLADSLGVGAKVELTSSIDRFISNRYVSQIVGPHGCGKTTLCHAIAGELKDIFPVVDYIAIRSGHDMETRRYLNSFRDESRVGPSPKLTIIDGAERVSLLQQRMIIANLTRRVASTASPLSGLLFTSHRPLKFVPILHSITPSFATFVTVAKYLDPSLQLPEDRLAYLFEQADHNIREAIMLLYDWHESNR